MGGIVAILIVGALLVFRRYQSRREPRVEVDLVEAEEDTTPYPFHPPPSSVSSSSMLMSQKPLAFSPISAGPASLPSSAGIAHSRMSYPSMAPSEIPRSTSPSPNIPSHMFPPPPTIANSPALLAPIAASPTVSRQTMAAAMEHAIQKNVRASERGRRNNHHQQLNPSQQQDMAPTTQSDAELLMGEPRRSEQFSPAPPSYTTHYDHHAQSRIDVTGDIDE